MNRSIEERSGEPRLSDLRESGSIEQDSDTVSFLHMDENEENLTQLMVKKNRHGRTGKVGLNWTKYNGRFEAFNQETTTA
jgi:replicative DNA helicase